MEKKYIGKKNFLELAQEILRRQGFSWLSNVKLKDCEYKKNRGDERLCFGGGFTDAYYELFFYAVNGSSRRCSLEIKKDGEEYFYCMYRFYEEWQLVYEKKRKAS